MKSCRPLLGTYVEIRLAPADGRVALAAMGAAYAAMEQVQRLMSLHAEDSDLLRINREAHQGAVSVHPWTAEVLRMAQRVFHASGGLFDCGVAHRLARWGLLPARLLRGPDAARIPPDQGCSSMAYLRVDEDDRVRAEQPMALDLGGIAKGYAVDQAAAALQAAGIRSAVINAGGDLRVMGDEEALIHVRNPRDPAQLRALGSLKEGALATSGSYFSSPAAAVPQVSALVDPRDGSPLVSERSYTVVAPTCMVADALTKVLAVGGDLSHPCFAEFSAHPMII